MKNFFISDRVPLTVYIAQEHARRVTKFLFLDEEGGILIAGGGMISLSHHNLLNATCNEIRKIFNLSKPLKLLGAGDCENGKIDGWRSVHYDIITPEEFRQPIKDSLGMN